jgi:hypothetical protein
MKLASLENHVHARRVMKSPLFAAVGLALVATGASAVPVIRGAAGYGMETPAGRGGKVIRVTNVNASGAGSLKACIDATGPRVCVFEVSGQIRLTQDLQIRNNNITIAGQTAPSPGIMIRGAALRIQAQHVLVQHIRVRAGDDPNGPDPANRDALKLEGTTSKPVSNVVIDHCSFSWSIDEVASVWGPSDNITFSNNIFAEPLHQSTHETDDGRGIESHGFGVLLGSSASGGRVTMVGNLLAHAVERNPLSRARELVFVNNVVYNRANVDMDVQSQDGRTTRNSIVGNVFLRGPNYARTTKPIYVRTNSTYRLYSGSRVYVHDNYAPEMTSSTSGTTLVSLTGGDVLAGLLQLSTAPVWNTGLTARATASNGVYNRVMSNVGARPTDRDSVDRRIVAAVKARNGQIINCVSSNGSTRCQKNAGGWPSYAQNTRRLTLPSNPNTVASNGYTNLENWLYSMDQSLQGVTQANSPASPATLSAR